MKVTVHKNANHRRGFTVIEVLIGLSVFIMVSAGALWGLNQLNYYASVNRLYTAAQTVAQNQIDLILTKGPYVPANSQTPAVLTTGTYYWTPTSTTGSATAVPFPLYYYTVGGSQVNVVNATLQTVVGSQPGSVGGTSLNLKKASVTVTYTFRNKTFNVKMDTIRAPDA